jgi:hypothetical protein
VVEVRLLGPVTVESDGRTVDLRRPLELALVARLALSPGTMISVERLLDDLWAESAPGDPVGSLQSLVENHGSDPDKEVLFYPQDYAAGRDPQLERAITLVLEALGRYRPALPELDNRPQKALPALPART